MDTSDVMDRVYEADVYGLQEYMQTPFYKLLVLAKNASGDPQSDAY